VSASPVFSLVTINPGATTTRPLTLTNQSNLSLNVTVESRGFTATDDKGGSDFPNSKSGPQHWFSFSPRKFTVPPHSAQSIVATVTVPKDAVSGGQYASVFFVASAPPDSTSGVTQVNYSARIGTYFFMTVGGNLHPDGSVTKFNTGLFWQHAPIHFQLLAHNFGNIHIKPHSTLQITTFSGRTVFSEVDPGLYILPGRTRTWEILSNSHLSPGYYHAKLTTKITASSKETTKTISFWIFPWQLFVLLLLTLLLGAVILRPQLTGLRAAFTEAGGRAMVLAKVKSVLRKSIRLLKFSRVLIKMKMWRKRG
jgi:hypothetical protein